MTHISCSHRRRRRNREEKNQHGNFLNCNLQQFLQQL